jgi:hypothetical protein
MEESGQNQSQSPTERMLPEIFIFAVANIVFGVLGILIATQSFWPIDAELNPSDKLKSWIIITISVRSAFAIGLIILGIGLIILKKWARYGCIIWAWLMILWLIFVMLMNLIPHTWIHDSRVSMLMCLGSICASFCFTLPYSILLLIFMRTEKVKRAFAAISG